MGALCVLVHVREFWVLWFYHGSFLFFVLDFETRPRMSRVSHELTAGEGDLELLVPSCLHLCVLECQVCNDVLPVPPLSTEQKSPAPGIRMNYPVSHPQCAQLQVHCGVGVGP